MTIIEAKNYEDLSMKTAALIGAQILKRPNSVLGLATGSSPVGAYRELIKWNQNGSIDFSKVTTINLDEYVGLSTENPQSYHYFMHENLFNHVNIRKSAVHVPPGSDYDMQKACDDYEKLIEDVGGIDLQLLGIGLNGHIAFNEPDDHFPPKTHVVKLTESTIDANARFYNSRDEVPKSAITMGIGTIMKARSIILIASGANKIKILEEALSGPVTPQIPASVLQYHNDLTVIYCK